METTVVGLFDSPDEAKRARQGLLNAGFKESQVHLACQYDEQNRPVRVEHDKGFWQSIKEALGFDDDDDVNTYYAEGVRRGGTLVSVVASGNEADRAALILNEHGAVDVNRRAQEWRKAGWTGYSANAPALSAQDLTAERQRYRRGAQTQTVNAQQSVAVPVIEEELAAGKRAVERGGVRVYRRVTERPVEAKVNLREERVNVQRRPANRELRPGETAGAFTNQVIEARETTEEAVIEKKARVTGEVVVGKEAHERTETVRDKVRRSDVEVERIPGKETTQTQTSNTQASTDRDRPPKKP